MCAFWLCFYNTALVFNKLTLLPCKWENMHTGCAGIAWRHFYAAIIKDVWFKATILVQPGMLEQEGLMAAAWGVGDGWHWLLRMLTALHQFDSGAAVRWRALCFKIESYNLFSLPLCLMVGSKTFLLSEENLILLNTRVKKPTTLNRYWKGESHFRSVSCTEPV